MNPSGQNSGQSLESIASTLQSCSALAWASQEQRDALLTHTKNIPLSNGETLFFEGDKARSFFVLLDGELDVIRAHPIHMQEMIVSRIFDPGESVGEIAAVSKSQIRSATIRASTDSNLVEIEYEAIDAVGGLFDFHLATIQLSQQYQLHDEALKRSYPYQLLTSTGPVKGWSHEKSYQDREVVFSEGDPSELVYFIISGQAKIDLRTTDGDHYQTVIGQGQIFGELGVIHGQNRSATVRADGKLRVLVVDASRFLTLSGANHELSSVMLLLRRIYRNGTGRSVLQFKQQEDGVAVFISSIDLPDDRQLVIQYMVNSLLVTMKADPRQLSSPHIEYKFEDARRKIRRTLNIADGLIVACEMEGPNPETGLLIAAIQNQTQLTTEQLDNFSGEGLLFTHPVVSDMVCHCMQITRSDLQEKIVAGCQTVTQLVTATGAGTVCGGCHAALEDLTGEASSAPVRMSQRTEVVPGIHRIRLTTETSTPLPASIPGQHIIVKGVIDGITVSRPYTLTSSHTENRWREITIRNEDHGLFSRWLCSIDQTETSLQISAPQGDFFVDMTDSTPVVMLAAGIGITPALAIARSRAEHQNGPKIHIDHSARTENQLVSTEELNRLATQHSSITYHSRRSSGGEKLSHSEIQQLHQTCADARWMICGPSSFEISTQNSLLSLGVNPKRIAIERFVPLSKPTAQGLKPDLISLGIALLTTALVALVLIGARVPDSIQSWQATFWGHWISGSALILFLGTQWWFPIRRWTGTSANVSKPLHWHRRVGAFSPLLLVLHGNSVGVGLLGLLTFTFLCNTVVGVADRSFFRDSRRQMAYLRWWLFPHILLSVILTVLAVYHVWVILSHGGP